MLALQQTPRIQIHCKGEISIMNETILGNQLRKVPSIAVGCMRLSLIVKVVVSKNLYFLFVQVIRYCSVPDVSINK